MPLTEPDVKNGIAGMLLEIWTLQKQLKEAQTELQQLKAEKVKDDTPDYNSRTIIHRPVTGNG